MAITVLDMFWQYDERTAQWVRMNVILSQCATFNECVTGITCPDWTCAQCAPPFRVYTRYYLAANQWVLVQIETNWESSFGPGSCSPPCYVSCKTGGTEDTMALDPGTGVYLYYVTWEYDMIAKRWVRTSGNFVQVKPDSPAIEFCDQVTFPPKTPRALIYERYSWRQGDAGWVLRQRETNFAYNPTSCNNQSPGKDSLWLQQ